MGSSGSREMVDRFRQKFIKEARAIAAFGFDNKHIVRIIDVFEENNTAYYVMEYVGGGSLSDKVKDGALPEDEAVRYIRQVATALEFVHSKHMMHLDVKPSNILLNENDETILIDFGLAKQYDTKGSQTSSTPVGISHGYAPLEQYKQGGVGTFSPATDIYSLGATLYKLLTGETPPEAGDVNDEGLPTLPQNLSATVRAAIETSMQPRRKDRPQSVGEFLALLDGKMKEHRGKSKDDYDGATIVGGSVMNNEILRSTQNDKEQKPVISTEHSDGENTSTDAGETVFNVVIPNVREESPKKRPSNNKRLLTIISVAAICIIAVFFGVKSCNDRKAAEPESQRATAIAEQQRIDADRKAQERADRIAAEQQRLEQERLAKDAAEKAEQERIAAEKKRKEEADRKAKEEAERLAAEKKRKEEERKRQEAAQTRGTINGHEWVDLGLSVKWATCNVGASSPGDYGRYYAWGETTTKSDYSEANSTTYHKQMTGIAGNSTYDVARREWGGTWRLPTPKEFQELIDDCTWAWTTQNGHDGYKVTSKKNGNCIFLPAAGWRSGTSLYDQGEVGYYWSATPYVGSTLSAYYMSFYFGYRGVSWYGRYGGHSVRPVISTRELAEKESYDILVGEEAINYAPTFGIR